MVCNFFWQKVKRLLTKLFLLFTVLDVKGTEEDTETKDHVFINLTDIKRTGYPVKRPSFGPVVKERKSSHFVPPSFGPVVK